MSESSIAQYDHFIPIPTQELLNELQSLGLSTDQTQVIKALRQVLSFELYLHLKKIKRGYHPVNPDNVLLHQDTAATAVEDTIDQIRRLLVQANFSELDQQQIEYALEKTSPYGLNIQIDFSAFERVILFYRGQARKRVTVRDWRRLFLKTRDVDLISYQRLFLVLQHKDQVRRPGLQLKLFKDILRPDLEMLFPDTKVRIKGFDKLKLIITGGGGTAGGLFATITKISAALNPWTIVIAIGGFAALLWRQISKVLVQNLYFHNMDNNLGAITYLVDLARQEEVKEACLAYAMLCNHAVANSMQLDDLCEQWLQQNWNIELDFDTQDALDKLMRLDLIRMTGDRIVCRPTAEALPLLQDKWMGYLNDE